jgi:hypothetical protein
MNMKRVSRILRASRVWGLSCFMAFAAAALFASTTWAAFIGEDLEIPKPTFTAEGEVVTAKLIPRGKNTSIEINFTVSGGKLESVEGKPFAEAERPEVDIKDFRSALFVVKATGVSPGGEAKVSAASNYFTASTEYWAFNPNASTPWVEIPLNHADLSDRVHKIEFSVKDGGPFDSDGKANGEIVLMGGPLDGFWSYAIGTLIIRFFGVFLVLSVLLIGLNIATGIFVKIDRHLAAREAAETKA